MKQVVITGLGVISPVGYTPDTFYEALLTGDCPKSLEQKAYLGHGDQFDSVRISKTDIDNIKQKLPKNTPNLPGITFGLYATQEAITDANLSKQLLEDEQTPLYIGNSEGDTALLERYAIDSNNIKNDGFCGYDIANYIAKVVGANGTAISFHNTCASAHMAMRTGFDEIRNDETKIALVGACDPFSLKIHSGFNSLHALSPNGCQPFDEDRKGIVISEGAVMFVLEEKEHALARNAKIYADILGVGISNDGYHLTHPNKAGVQLAIDRCIKEAGINAIDIDTIFAHATGTPANDKMEAEIFNDIFGKDNQPNICAIKSTVGHMMSAGGAANTLAACLSFQKNNLPPTKTTNKLGMPINLVMRESRQYCPKIILSNAYGFGGNNGAALLCRP